MSDYRDERAGLEARLSALEVERSRLESDVAAKTAALLEIDVELAKRPRDRGGPILLLGGSIALALIVAAIVMTVTHARSTPRALPARPHVDDTAQGPKRLLYWGTLESVPKVFEDWIPLGARCEIRVDVSSTSDAAAIQFISVACNDVVVYRYADWMSGAMNVERAEVKRNADGTARVAFRGSPLPRIKGDDDYAWGESVDTAAHIAEFDVSSVPEKWRIRLDDP